MIQQSLPLAPAPYGTQNGGSGSRP